MAELPIAYLAKVEVHSFSLCFPHNAQSFRFPSDEPSLKFTTVARQSWLFERVKAKMSPRMT